MADRPILFSGPMVRAILDGSKTQTRRVVMPQPKHPLLKGVLALDDEGIELYLHDRTLHRAVRCPYGKPGDRLWVREAWSKDCDPHWIMYRADGVAQRRTGGEVFDECAAEELNPNAKWKPSIHMPRWASRITLEVTEVRVERLQDISEADAKAEGCEPLAWSIPDGKAADLIDWPLKAVDRPYANAYALLWQSINGPGSWDANPWVWAISFKRVTP